MHPCACLDRSVCLPWTSRRVATCKADVAGGIMGGEHLQAGGCAWQVWYMGVQRTVTPHPGKRPTDGISTPWKETD